MYTYDERVKAVELLIKYDMSYSTVIRELGYPTDICLRNWYQEYIANGNVHENKQSCQKYTFEQKQQAVTYYLEHGKCVSRTCKKLGYPSRPMLNAWIEELAPNQKKSCHAEKSNVKFSQEQKEEAVISLCSGAESASKIATEYGTTRENLYNWKRKLLGKGETHSMKTSESNVGETIEELRAENEKLMQQRDSLQKEVYRLQLERDILETAAEVLKKGQGINLDQMTNREKAVVIDALREKYRLKVLLKALNISKSSYCYQKNVLKSPDKYRNERERIKDIFSSANESYGYRRIHAALKSEGIVISEKIVIRIMNEESLIVRQPKKKKYSSYVGEVTPAVENIIDRDFHADVPNEKWLTDITEFPIPAGKIYLSPIIDCFDGLPVAWKIGTSPNAELVNSMLDAAISTLKDGEHPVVHSDRGGHYRWPGWIERMEKAKLTRSMSKKGCSPDNSACEGFFGRLKNEMFYNRNWYGVSIEQFIKTLDTYMHWYCEKRIKLSLGGMSPLEFRRSLGIVA